MGGGGGGLGDCLNGGFVFILNEKRNKKTAHKKNPTNSRILNIELSNANLPPKSRQSARLALVT